MKRRLITLATVCAVALTTISIAQAQDPASKGPRWRDHGKGNMLEHLTKAFNLAPDQQQKFDAFQKAREDMRKAREEMRDAAKQ